MLPRWAALALLALVVAADLTGCRQDAPEPKADGNPYAECRWIIQWIRIHTGDSEAHVVQWGPREVIKSDTGEVEAVIIKARYQADIKHVSGVWSQKFRVENKRVSEETERTQEDSEEQSVSSEER
jgi:hypothetical protein